MKHKFFIMILLLVIFAFCCITFITISTGDYSTSYSGFAVDNNRNVFINCNNQIKVYNENKYLYSINPLTSRGYSFTISKDELFVQVGDKIHIFTKKENDIYSYTKTQNETSKLISPNNKKFTTDNGITYEKKSYWGRTQIVDIQSNDIVFEMPMNDYLANIILNCSRILFLFLIVIVLYLAKRKNDSTGDGSVSYTQKS